MLRYLSVCSGIEAASVAWEPLGFVPVGFAEIEAFPSAVLTERFGSNMPGQPLSQNGIPNHGDFTAIDIASLPKPIDLLVGGTPCQSFSIAGKRLSLADARGNLSLAYVVLAHGLADTHGLRNAVWENVPGVLSTADNAFGCFLGALVGADAPILSGLERGRWPDIGMVAGPRGRAAWRVLDAQYFGLAQRRRRVFVVADFGGGADPAAVLFERQGLRGHPPARTEARQGAAADAAGGAGLGGAFGGGHRDGDLAGTLSSKWAKGSGGPAGNEVQNMVAFAIQERAVSENPDHGPQGKGFQEGVGYTLEARHHVQAVAHALRADGFDASEDGTGRGTPLVPVAFTSKDHGADAGEDIAPTLRAIGYGDSHANGGGQLAVAFDLRGRDGGAMPEGPHDTANIRAASGGSSRSYVAAFGFEDRTRGDDGRGYDRAPHFSLGLAPTMGTVKPPAIATCWAVRRLTPTECERLQGFPDGWTAIAWRGKPAEMCPDGPRYKALGNSMAVPCMRWIGERLKAVIDVGGGGLVDPRIKPEDGHDKRDVRP